MEYKGYHAQVVFDEDADIFHGEVINLRDVITFEGQTVEELWQAFQDSVDDYLEFCSQQGEDPEKPYSGKLMIRVDPELHRRVAIEAQKRGVSINSLVGEVLSNTITENSKPLSSHQTR